MFPRLFPMRRSTTPSLSMSANMGLNSLPTIESSRNGLAVPSRRVNAGVPEELPVNSK
jgi:hypothetical protein